MFLKEVECNCHARLNELIPQNFGYVSWFAMAVDPVDPCAAAFAPPLTSLDIPQFLHVRHLATGKPP